MRKAKPLRINGHGLIGYSQVNLARKVLAKCERCQKTGPKARYAEHLREDHGVEVASV